MMFLSRHLRAFRLASPPLFAFSQAITVRYSPSGYTNLLVTLPLQTQKVFFINDKFTFQSLKDMFLVESPLSNIDVVYPPSLPLKDQSNVLKFLKESEPSSIQFNIDGQKYTLSNDQSFNANRIMAKILKKAENNKNSVLYWYQLCLESKFPRSNLGSMAYFMRILNHHLVSHGLEKSLSQAEIEGLVSKVLAEFGSPVNQKLEALLEEKNELDWEINSLEAVKESWEQNAKRRIVLYQKLILLISLVQFFSFYYMIFHVEWLGWDIIEPITYTISQITLVLGIRFFLKHGRRRDLGTMQEIFMNRIISKDRALRDRYRNLNEHILEKRLQVRKLEWKMELLRNQRTYDQFLKP